MIAESPTRPALRTIQGSAPGPWVYRSAASPLRTLWSALYGAKLLDTDTVSSILRVVGRSLVSGQWNFPSDVEALTQCDCYTGLLTRLATTRVSLSFYSPDEF